MKSSYFEEVERSASYLKKLGPAPDLCVVLGSGLADAISELPNLKIIPFAEIPGFKTTSVAGHKSELRVGNVTTNVNGKEKTKRVAFMCGRTHAYEGWDAGEVVHNLRSVISWGAKGVVLTNAAGCLNETWPLGSLMLISDHINMTGLNPLIGNMGKGFGTQFPDMTTLYDIAWREEFSKAISATGRKICEGVYYGVLGPNYETSAEIKMMMTMGASAVGMSTVLEAIAARHMGARVVGLSCMTNYGAGLKQTTLDHSHVMQVGKENSTHFAEVMLKTIPLFEV